MTSGIRNLDTSVASGTRPPIVAVLGHVDHGKTSLLDKIRKSNIAAKEAGGITQSIGASTIITQEGKKITFIDTPGHAAFSQMRSRGAKVADIVILVVAADDGIKPQTREALDHILSSDAKFLVASTNIDLPSASVEQAMNQLEELGVYFEGRGGQTPYVEISNKTGQGVSDLIDLIVLMSEVNEIKADLEGPLEAVVIETSKDKRGLLVSAVVRNGTLKVGMQIHAEDTSCKIRGLFNDQNKSVNQIQAGDAGVILGFSNLPPVGAVITSGIVETKNDHPLTRSYQGVRIPDDKKAIFVKTQTAGSLEALLGNIPADFIVIGSGVGDVTESDILFAKSSNVPIFLFEAKIPTTVAKLAEMEGVKIESFSIIYELLKKLEEVLKEGQKEIIGKAEVLAIFPYESRKVAGSKVTFGIVRKSDDFVLTRGTRELGKVKIVSMKKQKADINEAKPGEELGILFEPQFAFEVGDVLVSHSK